MLEVTDGCPAAKAGSGIVPEWTLKRSPVTDGKNNGDGGEVGSDPRRMCAALREMYKLHFPINEK
jgi:hypothetical protein